MEWTREERYKGLESISDEKYKKMVEEVKWSPWRQSFHIQPVTGLLNDPNGFIYYQGKYHLFYQWYPLGPVHGLKYWYHVTSDDLVAFKNEGPVVFPDTIYDSHGAYSGSSIEINGNLFLFYTGNHRTQNWDRIPYQLYAELNNDFQVFKKTPFIKESPSGYTEHVRDPKIWRENGKFYLVIGAQKENKKGRALIYQSDELLEFKLLGEIDAGLDNFGYMWECPDMFQLGDKDILLFCPQGLERKGYKYKNIFQSGYIIGDFDFKNLKMKHDGFNELDNGFDFYAPQTTLSSKGERVLIGWMGLPDTEYPTDKYGWAHCMTLPRVLTIEDGKLKQRIYPSFQKLRGQSLESYFTIENNILQQELIESGRLEMDLFIANTNAERIAVSLLNDYGESIDINVDFNKNTLELDRSNSGHLPSNNDDQKRMVTLEKELSELQLFLDYSSIELFINNGENVMSSRVFPDKPYNQYRISAEGGNAGIGVNQYKLKRG